MSRFEDFTKLGLYDFGICVDLLSAGLGMCFLTHSGFKLFVESWIVKGLDWHLLIQGFDIGLYKTISPNAPRSRAIS